MDGVKPQCNFCVEDSHGACGWPTKAFVEDKIENLHEGDIVRRMHDKPKQRYGVAKVGELKPLPSGAIGVELRIRQKNGNTKYKRFLAMGWHKMKVERLVPCGLPACESHLAARGPGIYVCRDHWLAWEQVA